MPEKLVLGIDVGGTKLAVGIVDPLTHTVITPQFADTPAERGGAFIYETIVKLCHQLPQLPQVEAIGVCFGGQVYENHVLRSNQVSGWDDFPLEERLCTDIAPLPIRIVNDANAIAWLEWTQRASSGLSSLFYVTVSTGIGGGLIRNGQIIEGRHGLVGEIGHMILMPDSVPCVCGRAGCLEALASGPSISRDYASITGQHYATKIIAQRAHEGDAIAIQMLQQSGRYVGRALAAMNILLDVDQIVIGGGVSRSGDVWWSAMREQFKSHLPRWSTTPQFDVSSYGTLEGVLAAAAVTTINNSKP